MNAPIWHDAPPAELRPSENGGAALLHIITAPSLTAALRALPHAFSVRLLHLGADSASPLLANNATEQTALPFCRDVFLCLSNTPVVWARSQCPPDSAFWRGILNCGTRPLGEMLFGGGIAGLHRSPLQYARPAPAAVAQAPTAFLARRSFFTHQGQTLALTECFLPELADFV